MPVIGVMNRALEGNILEITPELFLTNLETSKADPDEIEKAKKDTMRKILND